MALYLTEALISKGNHSEALDVLRQETDDQKLMPSGTFENTITGLPEDTALPLSAIIYLNMATLNFLQDNFEEA